MKIVDLRTYPVAAPTKTVGTLYWVFVRMETEDGIVGWGESGARRLPTAASVRAALEEIRGELIGQSAADIERIWHMIFHRYSYFGSRGFGTSVVAGVDMALWDINGKATGRPIYDLLGGRYRQEIPMYCNVWFDEGTESPESYAEAAQKYLVDLGHEACKLDPFREMRLFQRSMHKGQISQAGEQQGYEIVAAVRGAVGPQHEILIDAHGHYDVPTAVRLSKNLYERYQIGWFEEPVAPESIEALHATRAQTPAPICVGERMYTRYDFVPVLQSHLADYIMPDTVWTGGISEIKKIATLAEAYDIPISPHVVPSGPLGLLAAAHVMMTVPNFYRLEHAHLMIDLHNEMIREPYAIEQGTLRLNGKPGLGYDLDEDWLAAHAVSG